MTPILELKGITKVYGKEDNRIVAVDDVTLTIGRGEMLLVMGPSGSGKTTLLSIMGCILLPTEGDVTVDGKKIIGGASPYSRPEDVLPDIRKEYFGFVFQSFNLFPSLTAVENVGLILRLKKRDGKEINSEALKLIERFGLAKRAGFYPADMSGGEKQRVALARALAGDPPIILADEPTANLDSKTGLEVLGLLRGLSEAGKAVVIVSHDPKAETTADRIVYLEDGKIKKT
ncbi:MAG: ABC transporter ATP-binding protein [Nitrospiraceae bacterium]|nr:MAG: ABC transporter ATP-binding protein [Nitrospiraceae bacterium]